MTQIDLPLGLEKSYFFRVSQALEPTYSLDFLTEKFYPYKESQFTSKDSFLICLCILLRMFINIQAYKKYVKR